MSTELPAGWLETALSECVDVLDYMRVPVNSEERQKRPGTTPYYGATGQVGWIDDYLFNEELVLLGEDGAPFLDKSQPIAYLIAGKTWVNNHAHVLRAKSNLTSNRYLKFYLDSFDFREFVNGTTRLKLTQAAMNRIPVALAPFVEQRRIVEAIEQVATRLAASRKRLASTKAILRRLRQAILSAACSGRLTADWRVDSRSAGGPESAVETIRSRRLRDAKNERERGRLLELFSEEEESDSGALPDGWRFVRLNKLCASFDYGTAAKSSTQGTVPVLRMGNIQRGEIDWTDLVYASDREEIAKYALAPKTVLFNRTNSPELVGKTAIYRGERPAIFAGYLIRINPFPELDAEYLNVCLNTMAARDFCLSVKSDGVSQSNINAQKLGAFEVPLCGVDEQREIVRRANVLFKCADRIEAEFGKAQTRIEKLVPSLLAKAFRGELVPTEAALAAEAGRNYETASALLERIQRQPDTSAGRGRR